VPGASWEIAAWAGNRLVWEIFIAGKVWRGVIWNGNGMGAMKAGWPPAFVVLKRCV
jgi:hypothetical protein